MHKNQIREHRFSFLCNLWMCDERCEEYANKKKTFPKLLFNLKIRNLRRVLHNNKSGHAAAVAVVCVLFRKSNYFNSIL